MGKLGLNQLAAMNMVYNRYSFTYFLDSLERMGVKQFELWAGAPISVISSKASAMRVNSGKRWRPGDLRLSA